MHVARTRSIAHSPLSVIRSPGVATGHICTLSGTAGGSDVGSANQSGGPTSYVANDRLTVYAKKAGSPSAQEVQFMIFGSVD